jgi:hypothetical protein
MTEPTDINERRKAKAPRCELCGQGVHEWPGQCPRLEAIEYVLEDGTCVVYHLTPVAGTKPD